MKKLAAFAICLSVVLMAVFVADEVVERQDDTTVEDAREAIDEAVDDTQRAIEDAAD